MDDARAQETPELDDLDLIGADEVTEFECRDEFDSDLDDTDLELDVGLDEWLDDLEASEPDLDDASAGIEPA